MVPSLSVGSKYGDIKVLYQTFNIRVFPRPVKRRYVLFIDG